MGRAQTVKNGIVAGWPAGAIWAGIAGALKARGATSLYLFGSTAKNKAGTKSDIDLFIGSRVVSRQYGLIPRSHLLRNDGTGRFTDGP